MSDIQFVTGAGSVHTPSMAYYLVRPTLLVPPNHQHDGRSIWRWKYDNHQYEVGLNEDGSPERKAFPELVAKHAFEYFLIRPKGSEGGEITHGVEIEEVPHDILAAKPLEVVLYACPFDDCEGRFQERDALKAHILGTHSDLVVSGQEEEQGDEEDSRSLALSEIAARQRGDRPPDENPGPPPVIRSKEDRQQAMAFARSQKGKKRKG